MGSELTYTDWTERLCRHFFHEGRAQQPVTFFVDDELLSQIEGSGNPEHGVASLSAAIRSRISRDTYGRRFNRIDLECTTWKVSGATGCPPSLPLLAATVLAASRMAREQGIAAHNYWRRFRDLLDLHEENDLRGINDVLPGLWNQLSWWLDEHCHGNLGRSTIQEDPWWTIIGYALSQALFRESDRQHLTELFQKIGLLPGEEPKPQELLQYFKAWAAGSPLSPGARHMADDARYDDRLAAILVDEASRWDGVLRDERGRKIGALVLAYEPFPQPVYTIAAERPTGFPDHVGFLKDGKHWKLTPSIDGWYGETWPLDPQWLKDGLRLESDGFVLALRPSPVVPLAQNQILGCWASSGRVEPGEKYAILVEAAHAASVQSFLGTHARGGWRREGNAFAPRGWVLFTGVVIEESLPEPPPGPLGILAPRVRERPTLKGGLPLDDVLAIYLCGGEPDLWLPSLLGQGTRVTIDGRMVMASAGERVPLAGRQLPAGQHETVVGATVLRFSTTERLREAMPVGSGTLGHRLSKQEDAYAAESAGPTMLPSELPAGEVAVSGACLTGASEDIPRSGLSILLPLAARRYWLVGASPSEFEEPLEPARPRWVNRAGDGALYPIGFEATAPFDIVWVVVERQGEVTARVRTHAPPSADPPLPGAKSDEWCAVFDAEPELDSETERELWLQYRAAAAAIRVRPAAKP